MHHRQSQQGALNPPPPPPPPFFHCLFHLEACSGCDSAGFLLGTLWHAEILVASENVRIPKHSYLQAFVVKHAVYIM